MMSASSNIQNVAVLGGGTMGNGIAHVFAQNGFNVTLVDTTDEFLKRAIATITGNLDRQVKKAVITEGDKAATLSRLKTSTITTDVAGCESVIEAVFENLEIKRDLADPKIQSLLAELTDWPGAVLNSNKSASQPFHKLAFIADLGLNFSDAPVKAISKKVMAHQSEQGPFQLPMNIPTHFGGSGKDEWAWALCDAPILVSALIKMGLGDDKRVQAAVQYLDGLVRDNGFPCAVSPELGKLRGPGRKEDPCPFTTLAMLKLISRVPELREGRSAKIGVESLLTLRDESRERHPYMFFMGTDFRKLKAPMFWYDILHVLDILSQFKWARKEKRFREMLGVLEAKADDDGRYMSESIWTAWKDWDFSQKKVPSRGLTFFVQRILKERR